MQAVRQLVIGVDGGQSGTQTVLATTAGEILAAAVTGPMTHVESSGGADQVRQALQQGYAQVFAQAGIEQIQVGCVNVGLSAVSDIELVKSIYQTEKFTNSGDACIALTGAFPEDRVGVIVTAGTGSHAYGRRADGRTAFVGGRGYYVGDEGSAYDIAQQAFRAVYQAADGRSESTALTALILDYFQCQTLTALMFDIYANTYNRDQLAQVAKLVGQAANGGDPVARRILTSAGAELGKAVAAVLRTLEQTETPFPVAPNGGVFHAGQFITDPMMARVQAVNAHAYLTAARFPSAIGAVIAALLDLEIVLDDRVFSNLESSRAKILQKDTIKKIQLTRSDVSQAARLRYGGYF